jgi:cation diffusion facilitator CzcD-associated flavoprotein CzcO
MSWSSAPDRQAWRRRASSPARASSTARSNAAPEVGETWARLYDSLVLHTGRHLSALPGMPLPSTLPMFVPRRDFLDCLGAGGLEPRITRITRSGLR